MFIRRCACKSVPGWARKRRMEIVVKRGSPSILAQVSKVLPQPVANFPHDTELISLSSQ